MFRLIKKSNELILKRRIIISKNGKGWNRYQFLCIFPGGDRVACSPSIENNNELILFDKNQITKSSLASNQC